MGQRKLEILVRTETGNHSHPPFHLRSARGEHSLVEEQGNKLTGRIEVSAQSLRFSRLQSAQSFLRLRCRIYGWGRADLGESADSESFRAAARTSPTSAVHAASGLFSMQA